MGECEDGPQGRMEQIRRFEQLTKPGAAVHQGSAPFDGTVFNVWLHRGVDCQHSLLHKCCERQVGLEAFDSPLSVQ